MDSATTEKVEFEGGDQRNLNHANTTTDSQPKETAFLSGPTGTLGNEVLRVLLERGFNVKILVRDSSKLSPIFLKRWEGLPGSIQEIVQGDLALNDGATKGRIFSGMRDCTIVYHCAGVPEGWQVDEGIWDAVNRNGTEVMLEAAAAAKVRIFVHISAIETIAVSGGGGCPECKTDGSDSDLTPYQRSKISAENAVDLARNKGMQCVTINAASFYGPTTRSCWVNHFILSMLCGKPTKVPVGGLCVVYIPELARVVVEAGRAGVDGERYPVADAYLSTSEIAFALQAVLGEQRPAGFRAATVLPLWILRPLVAVATPYARWTGAAMHPVLPPGVLRQLQCAVRPDSAAAQARLGFVPTPVTTGLRQTVRDMREQGLLPALHPQPLIQGPAPPSPAAP